MIDLLSLMTTREGRQPSASGRSAWDREAHAAIAAAAARDIILREEDLIYLDVHDLQTLRWRIEHSSGRDAHHSRSPRAA